MSFSNIKVGELGNGGNNTGVLKELYEVKPNDVDLDKLIESLDTVIKRPTYQ